MVFTGFILLEVVKLYAVRWTTATPVATNPWLAAAVSTLILLQLAVLYTPLRTYFGTVPLGVADWGLLGVVVIAGAPLLVLVGWVSRRVRERAGDTPASSGPPT